MGRNRKTFTEAFKKEVAIEALKEQKTVNEIAVSKGISGSMVSNWKRQFLEGGFSKEVKQLKKELAESNQMVEETYMLTSCRFSTQVKDCTSTTS